MVANHAKYRQRASYKTNQCIVRLSTRQNKDRAKQFREKIRLTAGTCQARNYFLQRSPADNKTLLRYDDIQLCYWLAINLWTI